MMKDLGVTTLTALSHMIPDGEKTRKEPHKVSPSWVLVYRDLCEWAVLYERIGPNSKHDYDTQVVPLEKRTLRLANRWYGPTAHMMKDLHVRMPGWVDHLFDWS